MQNVPISTPTIKLGQFLKYAGIVDTGGAIKTFLATHSIKVNGLVEARRGRHLILGDEVEVDGIGYRLITDAD